MRRFVRRGLISVLLLVGLLVLIIAPFLLTMARNQVRLERYEKAVCARPLPPRTTRMTDCSGVVRLLGPASNHCDYRVRLRLRSLLPLKEIEDFYEQQDVPTVREGAHGLMWVRAIGPSEFELTVEDEGHAAGLDPRCH